MDYLLMFHPRNLADSSKKHTVWKILNLSQLFPRFSLKAMFVEKFRTTTAREIQSAIKNRNLQNFYSRDGSRILRIRSCELLAF